MSVKCAHFPARQHVSYTSLSPHTCNIGANASLSRIFPTFGSNFWVNKHRAALFLAPFLLLVCAPYLRLILAQTSMKPMQMIRERKVLSCGFWLTRAAKNTFEIAHEPPMHPVCCIFAPLSSSGGQKVGLMQKNILLPMFTEQKSKSFAF
jgi:hypothetical protein